MLTREQRAVLELRPTVPAAHSALGDCYESTGQVTCPSAAPPPHC
jgi:hypothetical protein